MTTKNVVLGDGANISFGKLEDRGLIEEGSNRIPREAKKNLKEVLGDDISKAVGSLGEYTDTINTMKPVRNTSGVVPYKDKQFIIQIRGTNSKNGEEYAFWGGSFEGKEGPLQAARREALEELKLKFKKYKLLGSTTKEQEKQIIIEYTFMVPLNDLSNLQFYEGKGIKKVTIEEARKLKMNPGDDKILNKIEEFLKNEQSL